MEPSEKTPKLYHAGTLTYTKAALVILFFWLIWGDICYMLMEAVTGPIMLLRYKSYGAANWEIALLLNTAPLILHIILNPVISFKSDRYRSRWGRRIPFLLFTAPIVALGLVGLAYGDRMAFWLHDILGIEAMSPEKTAMWLLGILLLVFMFFNSFVTSTFWYLFNDVVPEHLLARFMSWFRFVSVLCQMLYSFYIFPQSEAHAVEIFLGAAAVCLFGFGLMCLNVREGKYPPPPAYDKGKTGATAAVKTYAKECHSHRIYWYLWISTMIGSIGGGVATFDILFKQAIGLTLQEIGIIAGILNFLVAILVLIAGWLADRYQPARVVMVGHVLSLVILAPATFVWLFWRPEPGAIWTVDLSFLPFMDLSWVDLSFVNLPSWHLGDYRVFEIGQVFLVALVVYVAIQAPILALNTMKDPPMLMRTFPRSRYGQFCSVHAVWRAAGTMGGSLLVGFFFDYLSPIVGKDAAYYWGPVWNTFFAIPSLVLFVLFYLEWRRLGGNYYVPPVPGEDGGMAIVAVADGGQPPAVESDADSSAK